MAGDPVCDAFRAELQAILNAASPAITWPIKDTDNGVENPDASEPYIQIRFEGGNEELAFWGSPGSNLWREDSQAFIDFLVPLGDGREAQERNARVVRDAFRNRRFNATLAAGSVEIRIETASPLGGGQGVEGAMNSKSIGLGYRIYNVG
ncbi:MAG: hypothetical protein K9G48_08580 [Reyranella sp.]|nr:hypothetical protein [Reyranella sp.]